MIYSLEAEQSVLGALMLDETVYDQVISTGLVPGDFCKAEHQTIAESIFALADIGEPVDVITVVERLADISCLNEVGGAAYLSRMVDITPSIDNAKAYAEIVVERSRSRQFKTLGHNVSDLADEKASPAEIEDYIAQEMARISTGAKKSSSMSAGAAAKAVIDELSTGEVIQIYTTGLTDLDRVWFPEPGRLHIIAGRPKMGKSSLAQMILEANALTGIPGYNATMEMPAKEMAKRHIASLGRMDRSFFKQLDNHPNSDEQYRLLSAGVNIFKSLPIETDFCPGAKVSEIVNRSRTWLRKQEAYRNGGKGILVVDHLGLISRPGKGNDANEIGEITTRLKNLAGELNIPVILLCQLNRGVEQRQDKRPMTSDLRDSGRIEEDADTITFVYRDVVYNENTPDRGIAELITTANRNGESGTVRVAENLRSSRFDNLQSTYNYQN